MCRSINSSNPHAGFYRFVTSFNRSGRNLAEEALPVRRCCSVFPACAEHGALLLISSVRRSNVISCRLAPLLPSLRTMHRPFLPKPSTATSRPTCQLFLFYFLGGGVIAPQSKRCKHWEGDNSGTAERRGLKILYLGYTCVVLVAAKIYGTLRLVSPPCSYPTPHFPFPEPKSALSAPHLATMWRI